MKYNINKYIHYSSRSTDQYTIESYFFSPTDEIHNGQWIAFIKSVIKDTSKPRLLLIVCESPNKTEATALKSSLNEGADFLGTHFHKEEKSYRAYGAKFVQVDSIKSELNYTQQLAKLYSSKIILWGYSEYKSIRK